MWYKAQVDLVRPSKHVWSLVHVLRNNQGDIAIKGSSDTFYAQMHEIQLGKGICRVEVFCASVSPLEDVQKFRR